MQRRKATPDDMRVVGLGELDRHIRLQPRDVDQLGLAGMVVDITIGEIAKSVAMITSPSASQMFTGASPVKVMVTLGQVSSALITPSPLVS